MGGATVMDSIASSMAFYLGLVRTQSYIGSFCNCYAEREDDVSQRPPDAQTGG